MSHSYQTLEMDMLVLLSSIGAVFSEKEAAEVQSFIDVGEYGVAFETLCSIINEEQKSIPESARACISDLAHRMDIDREFWGNIVGSHHALRNGPTRG